MDELIFAYPTAELWRLLPYKEKGLIRGSNDALKRIVKDGKFLRRTEAEEDASYKQIISYGIISNKDSYFLTRRTTGQTEKRLHNQFSLGVGGHMNPDDYNETGEQYFLNELKREFFEEVKLLNDCLIEDIEFIGFLNDDAIPVGRFHIGLLYNIHVSNKEVCIIETDKMTVVWVHKSQIMEYYDGMETWSRIAFDYYIKKIIDQKSEMSDER